MSQMLKNPTPKNPKKADGVGDAFPAVCITIKQGPNASF